MNIVETTAKRRNGVTLVRAVVTNPRSTTQRVRLRHGIDGPVWVPEGTFGAATCWRDDVWEATLDPGEDRGLGFATPVAPEEPLLEVESSTRVPDDAPDDPDAVLGRLEEWSPPDRVLSDGRSSPER